MISYLLRVIRKQFSAKTRLLIVSIFVGIFAGLAAAWLKRFVRFVEDNADTFLAHNHHLTLIYPLMGILLTVAYYKYIQRAKLGKGLTDIIYDIDRKSGRVEPEKMYSHIISGALTVGLGGSTGLESPIVVTGSAIGSNVAKFFKLNHKERTILLACGASAGIAAIFNSPIAGVLFSIEVLISEFSLPTMVPLLVATATAAVVSKILYSGQLFFLITSSWHLSSIPFYFLLGIITGLASLYFIKSLALTKSLFSMTKNPWIKAGFGGLSLGMLLFVIPPLYGEGYRTIEQMLSGAYAPMMRHHWIFNWIGHDHVVMIIMIMTLFLVLIKPVATALTIGAGGNGGTFGPSLFVGACLGFLHATLINHLNLIQVPTSNFIVAGMAGVLSGVFHAPLTAIFLIAEITGGYALFVPLMIVAAVSYFIVRSVEPYNMYKKPFAQFYKHTELRKETMITKEKDKQILTQLKLAPLVETNFSPVHPDQTLGQLVSIISASNRNLFPVLDDKSKTLLGLIILDEVRKFMFQRDLYDTITVKEIMSPPPTLIAIDEPIETVLELFEAFNVWYLPVVSGETYKGFVSKSAVLSRYRSLLLQSIEIVPKGAKKKSA